MAGFGHARSGGDQWFRRQCRRLLRLVMLRIEAIGQG
jgi:hypothetical protein